LVLEILDILVRTVQSGLLGFTKTLISITASYLSSGGENEIFGRGYRKL